MQGHIDSAGTNKWASLTPAGPGELYFGYAYDDVGAQAGSTSGFTYLTTPDGTGSPTTRTARAQPSSRNGGQRAGVRRHDPGQGDRRHRQHRRRPRSTVTPSLSATGERTGVSRTATGSLTVTPSLSATATRTGVARTATGSLPTVAPSLATAGTRTGAARTATAALTSRPVDDRHRDQDRRQPHRHRVAHREPSTAAARTRAAFRAATAYGHPIDRSVGQHRSASTDLEPVAHRGAAAGPYPHRPARRHPDAHRDRHAGSRRSASLTVTPSFSAVLSTSGALADQARRPWPSTRRSPPPRRGTARPRIPGGSRTIAAPTNPKDGQSIRFELKQDATGSRIITWTSTAGGFSFDGGSAPTLTTTGAKTDSVRFTYNSVVGKWLYDGSNLAF